MRPALLTPDAALMAEAADRLHDVIGIEAGDYVFAVAPMAAAGLPAKVAGIAVVPREDVGNEQCWLMNRDALEADE